MPSLSKPGANLLFEAELAETVSSSLTGKSAECPILRLPAAGRGGEPRSVAASPIAMYSRYQVVTF
jgi:hypothetical protein